MNVAKLSCQFPNSRQNPNLSCFKSFVVHRSDLSEAFIIRVLGQTPTSTHIYIFLTKPNFFFLQTGYPLIFLLKFCMLEKLFQYLKVLYKLNSFCFSWFCLVFSFFFQFTNKLYLRISVSATVFILLLFLLKVFSF